ncbi:hypothetical protein [Sporolactobacillus laevolacticus]|uniref:Uncharacterized protein n=1 Tax=Sporolactobacillus laevolacticus DSM 442 TaxID=1395513 RepID=V6IY47_9BACL|nr:hypothetical protein [Sporolactobacillus laevolacticus]EST12373.1 hypothetical protein P343_06960 [Sporolactobacillus laevolacticus DSM 442]
MSKYAVYKGKVYEANMRNSPIRLKSRKLDSEFSELVDLAGNIHKDIFNNEVNFDDVEMIYELDYKLIYKGVEFLPLAVGKFSLDEKSITVSTSDRDIARNYGFIRKEPFVFDRSIPLDDIDALIEIKKPILKFKDQKEERTKIDHKDIKTYLANLI